MHIFLSHINLPGGGPGLDYVAVYYGDLRHLLPRCFNYLLFRTHVKEDDIHTLSSGMRKGQACCLLRKVPESFHILSLHLISQKLMQQRCGNVIFTLFSSKCCLSGVLLL